MAIQKEFLLRYRDDGHVRFQIPTELCASDVAGILTSEILAISGVYRANVYRNQRKLSIRYQETVCDFTSLAQQLYQLLGSMEKQGALRTNPASVPGWQKTITDKLGSFKLVKWSKEKYGDAKETVQAAKVITNIGLKKKNSFLKDPEKAINDFLTDVLVLFMIRLHWSNITQQWMLSPLKYRYEWMAVFYMVYLLVRSRKPK